ncbi:MAG: 4-hydroxybenzoate octaprenyltransferase [Hyphomicrobiaceae bacterium]
MTGPIPSGHAGTVADAIPGNWVDRLAPEAVKPYLRLARADRPIGAWLLMWPCWWSSALAAIAAGDPYPSPWHLALFLAGAFVMRAAGCAYNDLVDRDFDAKVERTRSRPIPSGQISVRAAKLFMIGLAFAGLLVLLQFNRFTILLGIASLGIVAIYPFMKRVTHWPQSVLGLAFGWGALMGFAARLGTLDWPAVALYAAAIAWIIGYDTIYAHQDKEDDALIGLKSTALRFGARTKPWLTVFYGLTLGGLGLAVALAGGGPLAFLGLGLAGLHMIWQIRTLDIGDGANCLARFRSNHHLGAIVFLGLLADAAIG